MKLIIKQYFFVEDEDIEELEEFMADLNEMSVPELNINYPMMTRESWTEKDIIDWKKYSIELLEEFKSEAGSKRLL
jgi:hypothetical protein